MTNKNVIIPEDYNDFVWRITYALLAKVAPFVPRSITPNQITYTAFSSGVLACLLLYFINSPVAYLYWLFFNFMWFLLDALDGIHARLTDQTSEFGGFLDHFLDNIFFIFMFTVFAAKFDLGYTIYICAIVVRITGALMVFLVQAHTAKMYLGVVSGGLELLLFSAVMLFSYFFPHFDPSQHTNNLTLLNIINLLHLQQGMFMKLAMLIELVGTPFHMLMEVKFVKKQLDVAEA